MEEQLQKILKKIYPHNGANGYVLLKEYAVRLHEQARLGNLVLVLGAGVSVPHHLPSWNTLLYHLLLTTVSADSGMDPGSVQHRFANSPIRLARFLEMYRANTSGMTFETHVRNLLYKDVKRTARESIMPVVSELARNHFLDSVITYNYDDLLEVEFRKCKDLRQKFKIIHGHNYVNASEKLCIYHIHGYLPSTGRLNRNHKIVLGEESYHQEYFDVYKWSNLVQIEKMKNKTCLFVGSSLTDPNLRRILDLVKPYRNQRHYVIREKMDLNTLSSKNKGDEEARKRVAKTFNKIDAIESDSLGVDTIWINDYTYLPTFLRMIMNP